MKGKAWSKTIAFFAFAVPAMLWADAPSSSAPPAARAGANTIPVAVSAPADVAPVTGERMIDRVSKALGLPVMRDVVPQRLPQIELRAQARESLSRHHPREWLSPRGSMLKMMGLLPADLDFRKAMLDRYPREVVGLYDAREGHLLIARDIDPEAQDEVLIHELVHTLQDQHYKLEQLIPAGQEDEERARTVRAVVEGQAVRVASKLSGSSRERILVRRRSPVPEPTPEILALLGPDAPAVSPGALRSGGSLLYQAGAAFVDAFEQKYGSTSAVFYALPISTEQLIHFDRYLAREKPMTVTLKDLPFKVAHQWRLVEQMTLGELNVAFWLGEAPGGPISTGWGGDRLAGFQSKDGKVMTAWRTVWDTEEDAIAFQDAARERIRYRFPSAPFVRHIPNGFILAGPTEAHGVIRLGTEVRLVDGASSEELENLLQEAW